ncbi:MAG: hypothetical protein ACFCVE_13800 [Phycisphaerae bacterium]
MAFYIGGRRISVCAGRQTQTVNVSASGNERIYDPKFRITDRDLFVNGPLLQGYNFSSVDALHSYLNDRCGDCLIVEASGLRVSPRLIEPDAEWVRSNREKLIATINNVVVSFVKDPYLHRVEHSIHCDLYNALLSQFPEPLEGGDFKSRLVHKEWPETFARAGMRGRGNFDLAVLSPSVNEQRPNRLDFSAGRIAAACAVEVGLNYDVTHLLADEEKLRSSAPPLGILVHLARPEGHSQDGVEEVVDRLIEAERSSDVLIAWACVQRGRTRYRLIGKAEPEVAHQHA